MMEMQKMKNEETLEDDKDRKEEKEKGGEKERISEATASVSLTEEKGETVYYKLGKSAEDIYSAPDFPWPSTTNIKDLCRRIQVYRGLSMILSILALILLAAVIILSVKLQTRAVCLEKETVIQDLKALPPQTCSAAKCRAMYPEKQTKVRACTACDPDWLQFEGSCFYLSREYRTWSDSREECRQKAGDLAVADNEGVQEFLTTKGNLMYWIGLSWDRTKGWVWVNNATVGKSYWSHSVQLGDCGFLTGRDDYRSSWSQSPCTYNAAYICQKEAKEVALV